MAKFWVIARSTFTTDSPVCTWPCPTFVIPANGNRIVFDVLHRCPSITFRCTCLACYFTTVRPWYLSQDESVTHDSVNISTKVHISNLCSSSHKRFILSEVLRFDLLVEVRVNKFWSRWVMEMLYIRQERGHFKFFMTSHIARPKFIRYHHGGNHPYPHLASIFSSRRCLSVVLSVL